ncbi:MAG: hypothetical protein ACRCRZ_03240 [Metamycoplasmataceae bacterium]
MELTIQTPVKIYSSLTSDVTTIMTSAKTFGELIPQLTSYNQDMKVTAVNSVTKEKIAMEHASTRLPENCILHIFSGKKNDSGAIKILPELQLLSYNELRKGITRNNLNHLCKGNPTKQHLLEILSQNFYEKYPEETVVENKIEVEELVKTKTEKLITEIKKPTNIVDEINRLIEKIKNLFCGNSYIDMQIDINNNTAYIKTTSEIKLSDENIENKTLSELTDEDVKNILGV